MEISYIDPFPSTSPLVEASLIVLWGAMFVTVPWVLVRLLSRRSTAGERRSWLGGLVAGAVLAGAAVALATRLRGADAVLAAFSLLWLQLALLFGSLSLLLRRDPVRRALGIRGFQCVGVGVFGYWSTIYALQRVGFLL